MTLPEFGRRIGVGPDTVAKWARLNPDFPAVAFRAKYKNYYLVAELDAWCVKKCKGVRVSGNAGL